MKRIYAMLPGTLGKQLRNVLEFDGCVAAGIVFLSRASSPFSPTPSLFPLAAAA